jgi:peptidoglycan/LPS O-acetylase OafA/YrhL
MRSSNVTTANIGRPVENGTEGKAGYIDAIRGWAILLVITPHVGLSFAELPFPIRKLTNFGWNGVQMFFLASAVSLMLSWRRQKETGWTAVRYFFIRRFLRIAPMYYAGAIFYYIVEPPVSGFDFMQMLRSLLFINAWHPNWMPTTPGWKVVPGGWSIGVEFTFYILFPILATILTTLPRALVCVAGSLILAVFANQFGTIWLANYSEVAANNFLFFWFPNQAPIFALGIVLYHLLTRAPQAMETQNWTSGIATVVVIACVVVAEFPTASNSFHSFIFMPTVLIATLIFMVFILVLAKGAPSIFVHSWLRRLGSLSFSAYILHFFFVDAIPVWSRGLIDVNATGFKAIGMCILLWILTIVGTVAVATFTHIAIEQPGINLARRLTSSRAAKVERMASLRLP